MPRTLAPLRSRLVALLLVYLGTPVLAEYLQSYLASTGDAAVMLGGLLVLGPLYGGAALLIREVAVRRGLGWRGVLLLGAAWGVLMPGVIDLALFGAHRDDVGYWDALREPTLVEPLGIGVFNTVTWVSGHVLLSVLAPLGLLHALAPRHRDRPLLGRVGLVAVPLLLVLAASFIHSDGRRIYDYAPSTGQVVAVLAVVLALVVAALGALGRPGRSGASGPAVLPSWRPVALPVATTAVGVVTPPTWAGVVVQVVVLAVLGLVVLRWSRTRRWGSRQVGLVAAGLVLGQTLAGFASPVPDGVDEVAKTLSQLGLLALAVGLLVAVARTRSLAPAPPVPVDAVGSEP